MIKKEEESTYNNNNHNIAKKATKFLKKGIKVEEDQRKDKDGHWRSATTSSENGDLQQQRGIFKILGIRKLQLRCRRVYSKSSEMASATAASPPTTVGGGHHGPLSFMGCVREASPPPLDYRSLSGLSGDYAHGYDTLPKEPKKRRFHPLRGLRRIFRKKSRSTTTDTRLSPGAMDRDAEHLVHRDHEEVTLRDPAGRAEEIRSRSASELLTDPSDRESIFLRRRGIVEESFANLQRGVGGQLSVSHDSVFPGEVSHVRPLSALETHASLERRQNKSSNCSDLKDTLVAQKQRLSLRVLEQIKTVIENRNQVATSETTNLLHGPKKESPTTTPTAEFVTSSPVQESLPELPTGGLNHTAAHHRISVRPKNRRPPRRSTPQPGSNNNSLNYIGLPRIDSLSEMSMDVNDSLENSTENNIENSLDSPVLSEPVIKPSILRKSSSRASRSSGIFGDVHPVIIAPRKHAVSPDSLESLLDSKSNADVLQASDEKSQTKVSPKSSELVLDKIVTPRKRCSSNRMSKSPDSLECDSPSWLSKSSEGFDKLKDETEQKEAVVKPVAARRLLLNPISKSSELVCNKNADSLDTFNELNSDDSIDRRRSCFEIRSKVNPFKAMSKSFECFESLDPRKESAKDEQKRKRATVSEINLSRSRTAFDKLTKSSESFEKMTILELGKKSVKDDENDSGIIEMHNSWRPSKRTTNHSSESSDNLDLEDCKLENRNISKRSTGKIFNSTFKDENEPVSMNVGIVRKASNLSGRLQKSSESSELGSTDTLDSERRHMKSSDSDETLDSLEKDYDHEHEKREEDTMDNSVTKKLEKNMQNGCSEEESNTSNKVAPYWRRTNNFENKDSNIDLHSLLGYSIVSKITKENGNNDEERPSLMFPSLKKRHQPPSPITSEDNKTLSSFSNLLTNTKNDEDLQNMLNGNISEVSTESTKSFKEKLIMFEKLGK